MNSYEDKMSHICQSNSAGMPKAIMERFETNYTCGGCDKRFQTICLLHEHLRLYHDTGSYVLDNALGIAFPRFETTCSFTQTDELLTGYMAEFDFTSRFSSNNERCMDNLSDDFKGSDKNLETFDSVAESTTKDVNCKRNKAKLEVINSKICDKNSTVRNSNRKTKVSSNIKLDTKHIHDTDQDQTSTATAGVNYSLDETTGKRKLPVAKISVESENIDTVELDIERKKKKLRKENVFLRKLLLITNGASNIREAKDRGNEHDYSLSDDATDEANNSDHYDHIANGHVDKKGENKSDYFTGEIKFSSLKIKRPYYSDWDKSGKGDNSTVRVSKTFIIPSGLPIRRENSPDESVNTTKTSEINADFVIKHEVDDKFEIVGNCQNENVSMFSSGSEPKANHSDEMKPGGKCDIENTAILITERQQKSFICNICGKEMNKRANFDAHVNRHLGKSPFICETCGKAFPSSQSMLLHKRNHHTPQSDWKTCALCDGKSFATDFNLRQHIKNVHHNSSYVFKCYKCDKIFTNRNYLQKHRKVHKDGKNYECDICLKIFKSESGQREHRATHFNLYECEICDGKYSSTSSLRRHMKSHADKKDHVCHICGHSFNQKNAYWSHMEKHHDLTKMQLIVMFPDKHLQKNLHHKLPELKAQLSLQAEDDIDLEVS